MTFATEMAWAYLLDREVVLVAHAACSGEGVLNKTKMMGKKEGRSARGEELGGNVSHNG